MEKKWCLELYYRLGDDKEFEKISFDSIHNAIVYFNNLRFRLNFAFLYYDNEVVAIFNTCTGNLELYTSRG